MEGHMIFLCISSFAVILFDRKVNFAFGGIVPQPKPNAKFTFPKFDYRL